ncbi:hypothetical protein Sjap_008230 [Stephania japonica]|uniref:Uncharacterized protein n=1 Tax=Stephania japonica TaxID=461633 RepID=A0AAP0PE97_9MAGN
MTCRRRVVARHLATAACERIVEKIGPRCCKQSGGDDFRTEDLPRELDVGATWEKRVGLMLNPQDRWREVVKWGLKILTGEVSLGGKILVAARWLYKTLLRTTYQKPPIGHVVPLAYMTWVPHSWLLTIDGTVYNQFRLSVGVPTFTVIGVLLGKSGLVTSVWSRFGGMVNVQSVNDGIPRTKGGIYCSRSEKPLPPSLSNRENRSTRKVKNRHVTMADSIQGTQGDAMDQDEGSYGVFQWHEAQTTVPRYSTGQIMCLFTKHNCSHTIVTTVHKRYNCSHTTLLTFNMVLDVLVDIAIYLMWSRTNKRTTWRAFSCLKHRFQNFQSGSTAQQSLSMSGIIKYRHDGWFPARRLQYS